MSHTGHVMKPQASPGYIYSNTIGHAIIDIDGIGQLIFCKAAGNIRQNLEDRLIAYHSNTMLNLKAGDSVIYNLRFRTDADSITGLIMRELEDLEEEIAERHHLDEFQFKYIATNIEKLDEKAALSSLYREFNLLQFSRLNLLLDADAQWDIATPKQIKIGDDSFTVKKISVLDRQSFRQLVFDLKSGADPVVLPNVVSDYQDNIDAEISDVGEHVMSTADQIPILLD